jgi:hypothetical protein
MVIPIGKGEKNQKWHHFQRENMPKHGKEKDAAIWP